MFSYGLPDVLRTEYITPEEPGAATWQIPSGAPLKKRIAMYFCNALFGLMLFWFQDHFPLSGKMILLTKKKITIDTPPFRTVVPML